MEVAEIGNDFSVGAAPATVYGVLDLERVETCIPGASVAPPTQHGAHPGEIAVRLGPVRLTYRGNVRIDERDDGARRATLLADVGEVRGQGAALARMSMAVSDHGRGAHVVSTTAVELTGRAAQMGGGIVEDVAGRLVADIASRLEQLLAPATGGANSAAEASASSPIGGLRLLLRALWHRLRYGKSSHASVANTRDTS